MQIWYMNGAGNDFVVMDARGKKYDFSKLALDFCEMFHADGFMALDDSELADFKLHFYNADGSRGEMCGNGARCICRFAYEHGVVGESMEVETDAGIVSGWRLNENWYKVKLNPPGVLDLKRKKDCAYVELGNPGVPHAVKEIKGLHWEQREELREMAKNLRYDDAFPKGANVNLYDWISEDEIRILTYERGVEDYTLACGTGSASVAVILREKGDMVKDRITIHNPGGTLVITLNKKDENITEIYLEGPTQVEEIRSIER